MTKTHELKTWPIFFEAVWDGRKTFEVRKNDRDFRVGDWVRLREYFSSVYSGRVLLAEITYILPAFTIFPNSPVNFTLPDDFVVMSIKILGREFAGKSGVTFGESAKPEFKHQLDVLERAVEKAEKSERKR